MHGKEKICAQRFTYKNYEQEDQNRGGTEENRVSVRFTFFALDQRNIITFYQFEFLLLCVAARSQIRMM